MHSSACSNPPGLEGFQGNPICGFTLFMNEAFKRECFLVVLLWKKDIKVCLVIELHSPAQGVCVTEIMNWHSVEIAFNHPIENCVMLGSSLVWVARSIFLSDVWVGQRLKARVIFFVFVAC